MTITTFGGYPGAIIGQITDTGVNTPIAQRPNVWADAQYLVPTLASVEKDLGVSSAKPYTAPVPIR